MFVLNSTRGEHTQAEINRAAHQIFQERGFHDTSVRDIARKAGIAIGGFYNHISSKEDIFLNVFIEHHPDRAILPAINFVQEERIETFVRDVPERMLEASGESQDFLNLTFIELVEFKGKHIPLLFESIFPKLLELTQRMVSRPGELRSIPLPVLLRAFIGLFFSFYITELLLGKQLPDETEQYALNHFVDIYLHGILKDSSDTEASPIGEWQGITTLNGL